MRCCALVRCCVFVVFVVSACGSISACGSVGDVVVRANGAGTDAVDAAFFADGANVAFDQFVVVVDGVDVGDGAFVGPAVVDVSAGAAPVEVGVVAGLERGEAAVSAIVAPSAAGAAVVAANVDADVVDAVTGAGFSLLVRGSAVLDGAAKTFNWGFTTNTRYVDCAVATTVTAGAQTELQLTFHGDHLFLPTLDDDAEVGLRFAALAAADDNGDDAIDVDELAGVDLADLADGYDASADPSVVTLYDFLQAQTRTLLHLNGDNECDFEKR